MQYDFIEFMACPGGCVNGGGQPLQPGRRCAPSPTCAALRAKALYKQDQGMEFRKSHENPVVKEVYDDLPG